MSGRQPPSEKHVYHMHSTSEAATTIALNTKRKYYSVNVPSNKEQSNAVFFGKTISEY